MKVGTREEFEQLRDAPDDTLQSESDQLIRQFLRGSAEGPLSHQGIDEDYEKDLLRMIEEEIGDADPKGTLQYVKDSIKNGKTITVGSCRFKLGEKNVSK